jgi:hypothetical protein
MQIYDDINIVLFRQNTFFPWVDKKYEKRIRRLMTMLFISNLSYANGKYTLIKEARSILKDLVNTCVIIFSSLSQPIYTINYRDIQKYIDQNYAQIDINTQTTQFLVDTININNELIDFCNIYKINKKYSFIKYLINFILIYYKLFSDNSSANNRAIVEFTNIYRFGQLWTQFDIADSDNVARDMKNKYTKLLKTIIEIGRVLLLIF